MNVAINNVENTFSFISLKILISANSSTYDNLILSRRFGVYADTRLNQGHKKIYYIM